MDVNSYSSCGGREMPTGTNWQNYVSSYNGSYSSWSDYDRSDYSSSDYVSYEILSSSASLSETKNVLKSDSTDCEMEESSTTDSTTTTLVTSSSFSKTKKQEIEDSLDSSISSRCSSLPIIFLFIIISCF